MVKAFSTLPLWVWVSARSWQGWTEICGVGVSGPPRSRSYRHSSAQPRVSECQRKQSWGSGRGRAAEHRYGGVTYQKWGTLVRMENTGGLQALGEPFWIR